jgi:hypothetical protein
MMSSSSSTVFISSTLPSRLQLWPQEGFYNPGRQPSSSRQHSTRPRNPQAYLLGLPRELRDIISSYCIPVQDVKYSLLQPSLPRFQPNLHRTCRQLYAETNDLYYAQRIFLIERNWIGGLKYSRLPKSEVTPKIKRVALRASISDQSTSQFFDKRIARSRLARSLQPTDLIFQLCTCKLAVLMPWVAFQLMPQLRKMLCNREEGLLEIWQSLKTITFFYCDDKEVGFDVMRSAGCGAMGLTIPASFTSAFGGDSMDSNAWLLVDKAMGDIGHRQGEDCELRDASRTVRVRFYNVARVYGKRCVEHVVEERW